MSSVLIVEDEALIALDLEEVVRDCGYDPDGPYGSVAESLRALDHNTPDCAVLDVRILDGEVFPVADRLQQRQVSIIFYSGHANQSDLRRRYPTAQICMKPASHTDLMEAITSAVRMTSEKNQSACS